MGEFQMMSLLVCLTLHGLGLTCVANTGYLCLAPLSGTACVRGISRSLHSVHDM